MIVAKEVKPGELQLLATVQCAGTVQYRCDVRITLAIHQSKDASTALDLASDQLHNHGWWVALGLGWQCGNCQKGLCVEYYTDLTQRPAVTLTHITPFDPTNPAHQYFLREKKEGPA